VRAAAARAVHDVAAGGLSLDAALAGRIDEVVEADRALLRELTFGTMRWYWRCIGLLGQLVERRLKNRDRVVESLMAVGIYQLERMRLPSHAAVHATVAACTALDRPGFKGLVNGVLRNFQRRGGALAAALPAPARDACPEWLWRAIHEQWPGDAARIIEAGNERPPLVLRVNRRRTDCAAYLARLESAGIAAHAVPGAADAIVIAEPVPVERLAGFARGLVSVQDAAAQMLPGLARPVPGDRVLDACAAPGGKLAHLLEACPGISAQALELDPRRAGMITENLARLGLEATVTRADAALTDTWWDGRPFDRVVIDAPCSGSGVIRRHPDIKVLRRPGDLAGFARDQLRLMAGLWPTLRPGGRLVYATCSILGEENGDVVEQFLGRTPDCREVPGRLPRGRAQAHGGQIIPEPDGWDGFYYAIIEKQQ